MGGDCFPAQRPSVPFPQLQRRPLGLTAGPRPWDGHGHGGAARCYTYTELLAIAALLAEPQQAHDQLDPAGV